jgi:hypothetical protein
MTTVTQAYSKDSSSKTSRMPRERTGGARGDQPETSNEQVEYFVSNMPFGSHMPLDTQLHWDWRNPLNIIPAFMLLLLVLTIVVLLVR